MVRNDKGNAVTAEDKRVEAPVANPFSATEEKGSSDVVRFWSTQKHYTIAIAPGKNLVFDRHILALEPSDPAVKTIRNLKSSDIREVLDVPFKSDEELSRFNQYLQKIVYAGERMTVSKRGLTSVIALFHARDGINIGQTPELLIMQALKKKSFREGI